MYQRGVSLIIGTEHNLFAGFRQRLLYCDLLNQRSKATSSVHEHPRESLLSRKRSRMSLASKVRSPLFRVNTSLHYVIGTGDHPVIYLRPRNCGREM